MISSPFVIVFLFFQSLWLALLLPKSRSFILQPSVSLFSSRPKSTISQSPYINYLLLPFLFLVLFLNFERFNSLYLPKFKSYKKTNSFCCKQSQNTLIMFQNFLWCNFLTSDFDARLSVLKIKFWETSGSFIPCSKS